MMDSEQEIIELSTSEDTESEEENEKKEKEDKNNLITLEFNVIDSPLRFASYWPWVISESVIIMATSPTLTLLFSTVTVPVNSSSSSSPPRRSSIVLHEE